MARKAILKAILEFLNYFKILNLEFLRIKSRIPSSKF